MNKLFLNSFLLFSIISCNTKVPEGSLTTKSAEWDYLRRVHAAAHEVAYQDLHVYIPRDHHYYGPYIKIEAAEYAAIQYTKPVVSYYYAECSTMTQ